MSKVPANPLFVTMDRVSKTFGENNDCTVKALAVAARIPYEEAHADLSSKGRRNRRGFYTHYIIQSLIARGFEIRRINIAEYMSVFYPKGHKYQSITMLHFDKFRRAFGNSRFIVQSRGHVATYDGNNGLVDWSVGRSQRVREMYIVLDKPL